MQRLSTTSAGQQLNKTAIRTAHRYQGHGRKLLRASPANAVSVAAGAPHGTGRAHAARRDVTPVDTPCRQGPSYPDPGPRHATPASTQSMTIRVLLIWAHASLGVHAAGGGGVVAMAAGCAGSSPPRVDPPGQEISARRRPHAAATFPPRGVDLRRRYVALGHVRPPDGAGTYESHWIGRRVL